jgi:hypothetical protein
VSAVGTCALCHLQRQLRNSHVLPELCYKPLYETAGTERRAILIARDDARHKKPYLREGLRHPLLCADCEGFLSREYEEPFAKHWMSGACLPQNLTSGLQLVQTYDYRRFKLFHLSVLWRAGIDAQRFGRESPWHRVYLGKHEERLRTLIRSGDPGQPGEYPIAGWFVTQPTEPQRWTPGAIHLPVPHQVFGMNCYKVMFAGASWVWFCSSHTASETTTITLRTDGVLSMTTRSILEDKNVLATFAEDFHRTGGRR